MAVVQTGEHEAKNDRRILNREFGPVCGGGSDVGQLHRETRPEPERFSPCHCVDFRARERSDVLSASHTCLRVPRPARGSFFPCSG